MIVSLTASATDYYVSTTGSDSNDGKAKTTAFATLGKAQTMVKPGDKVYILPGKYEITEEQIAATAEPYKIVFNMNHKGSAGKPICFIGLTEGGERPVFDLSQVNPAGYRVTAFLVSGQYLVFRNFEVVGIKVNITDHTQSENIRVTDGSYNTFENIACHDGMGIGFYLTRRSHHNLFVNCDGYNNYDSVSESGKGGQNDGFGCHVLEGQENNIFIGCRAWNNSDDGFDLINCYSPVTFSYSIAYKNGYDADGTARQDGNGFKAGGFGMGSAVTLPATGAPRHVVNHCLAVQNKSNGIYSNHHLGGIDFTNNTAVDSRYYSNFAMVNRKGTAADENVDVNGYGHKLENNLSISQWNRHIGSIDATDGQNTLTNNSFTWNGTEWVNSYTADFASTNVTRLIRARLTNGYLDPTTTLTVYKQNTYSGKGCDFSGYEDAVEAARQIAGAGEEDATEVKNTYIGEGRTWDFSDMTEGSYTTYTDYHGLILRGTTADNHGITTKPGSVSFYGNGAAIETSYLIKNKQAADDIDNTSYDRCLAFNASVPGTTTVTFSASSNNAERYFQVFFKAKDKEVQKSQEPASKTATTVTLTANEAGSFFIAATIACNVSNVTFTPTGTGITTVSQELTENDTPLYDLSGRVVKKPTRGLYIRNGRKFMIK